jgi:hypothetical protein
MFTIREEMLAKISNINKLIMYLYKAGISQSDWRIKESSFRGRDFLSSPPFPDRPWWSIFLKGSNDGVQYTELLGFWAFVYQTMAKVQKPSNSVFLFAYSVRNPGVKRLERDTDHSPPPSVKV